MPWIYLAASVEILSPSESGLTQSPTANKTTTPSASFSRVCQTDSYPHDLSGTTLPLLPEPHSRELTLSSAASPVRTSVWQDMERAWKESEADYSTRLSGSQKKLERRLCSSKTSPQLELADFEKSSEHLPSSGMTVAGRVYLPLKLEPSTFVNDGSFLPTPTACDYGKNVGRKSDGITPSGRDRWSLTVRARRGELPAHPLGYLNPQWIEQAMGFPIDWTVTVASVMPSSQPRRAKRSKS
jgi:hypothetical protein